MSTSNATALSRVLLTTFVAVSIGIGFASGGFAQQNNLQRTPARFPTGVSGESRGAATFAGTPRPPARTVIASGTSTCAACEFGVRPLSNPEELGLAIKTANGIVVVVENAHALYPKIYAARFQGQQLQARGEIIRRDGDVVWLRPSSLRVMN